MILLLLGSLVLNGESFQPSSFFFPLFFIPLSSLGGHFLLYISFSLILAVHLLITQVAIGVPVPSAAFLDLL